MSQDLLELLDSSGVIFQHNPLNCSGFHGTSVRSAELILRTGFRMDLADPRAWLGPGVYFYDDEPYLGAKFALCWARHLGYKSPAVLKAELRFRLLLDLERGRNKVQFWKLRSLLQQRRQGDEDISERFVAFYIGTRIAPEMGSDGVGWKFPMMEPPDRRRGRKREQHGFVVKKLNVIVRVTLSGAQNES